MQKVSGHKPAEKKDKAYQSCTFKFKNEYWFLPLEKELQFVHSNHLSMDLL